MFEILNEVSKIF